MPDGVELSVIVPCLNEARSLEAVIGQIRRAVAPLTQSYEILVADNGSDDGSVEVAEAAGARVVPIPTRGYGAASLGGARAARGAYLVFLDADGEHDPNEIGLLLTALRSGAPLVLGSRYRGRFLPGSNPFLNRAIGTPFLTWILNATLKTRVSDANSGFKGLTRATFDQLGLRSTGMELSTEIIARAGLYALPIAEVPITQHPAPPGRRPHLRRFRDGWRHLQFILLHAPDRVLLFPGLLLVLLGLLFVIPQAGGPIPLGRYTMDLHLMLLGALFLFMGLEMSGAAVLSAQIAGAPAGPSGHRSLALGRHFGLGQILPWASFLFVLGFACDLWVVVISLRQQFQLMEPRLALLGTLGMGLGVQLFVLSFVHSSIEKRGPIPRDSSAP